MSEPTAPPPPPAGDSGNRTLMLVLSYLFPLSLIPLLTEKEDKEVQWHAKHGIVIGVLFAILFILAGIFTSLPLVGCLGLFLWPLLFLGWVIVTILCIVKATQGQRFLIPMLSDYANKF